MSPLPASLRRVKPPVGQGAARALWPVAAAAGVGLAAWGHGVAWMPLALLFPVCWMASGSRWQAAAVAAAYHLAAARGLPAGAAVFFGSGMHLGIALWLAAGVLQALAYALAWSPQRRRRLLGLPLALLLVSMPPFGVVGWVNPLTAAGVLFPGLGWAGLGLTLALVLLVASWRPVAVALLVVPMAMDTPVAAPVAPWVGLTTHFHFDSGGRDYLEDYYRQIALQALVRDTSAPVVVLPETSGGRWTGATRALWEPLAVGLGDRAVLLGAELPAGAGYDNALIALDGHGDRVVYRQRMPVPVSMWKPWTDGGAVAHWFEDPVFELAGRRVAPLICYEQLLVWPVLQSLAHHPDVLVGVGNSWWAADTSIPSIQSETMEAWARLFAVPLVMAVNY